MIHWLDASFDACGAHRARKSGMRSRDIILAALALTAGKPQWKFPSQSHWISVSGTTLAAPSMMTLAGLHVIGGAAHPRAVSGSLLSAETRPRSSEDRTSQISPEFQVRKRSR